MITVPDMREHVLTAAEKYDLPLSIRQADTLSHHLAVYASEGAARKPLLTDCQLTVLVGLASGESAKETGQRIGRTENTIKTHRRLLYKKLGARSGAHAVTIAIAAGLLRSPRPVTLPGGDAR